MPAETQLGPFLVERELGRGGMGVVYAARHEGRPVAVKVSLDEVSPREKKNFLQEAELLSRISHPGVIEILGSGTLDDGRPYLVMPLLPGESLGKHLERGRLPADLALRLFAQLAAAVAALHDAGIVHRDIKPENVMVLEEEERLVLLDFGIARDLDGPAGTTTRLHMVRGTPGFMAPERFFGMRASASSDVYELAVVLYAMVVGRLPWDDPTDPEGRLRPRHPAELGVELPVGLGHVLLEALSSRPDRRPSARELAVKVRALEGSPLTPGRSPGAPGHTTIASPVDAGVTPPAVAPWTPATPRPAEARRAEPLAPAPVEKQAPRGPAAAWVAVAVLLTSLAVGGAFSARARRAPLVAARAGLGRTALAITLRPDPTGTPAAAGAALPTATAAVAVAEAPPSSQPSPRKLATAVAASPMASAAAAAAPPPAVEKTVPTPPSSEAPEDMPWCKRVAAAYCSAEVKNSAGGDHLCASGTESFYTRFLSRPPPDRVAQNDICARVHRGVVSSMHQQARDMGPGTAGSARYAAAFGPRSTPATAAPAVTPVTSAVPAPVRSP